MGTIAEARDKVITMLTTGLGLVLRVSRDGTLVLEWENRSTAVFIDFELMERDEGDEPDVFMRVSAPILREVKESPELYKWIATEGAGFRLGCIEIFNADETGLSLHFKYSMLADYLDEPELAHAVYAVLACADGLDDKMQALFGGKRFIDED